MQVTNFSQTGAGVQTPAATNTAVNGNTEQLSNSVAPSADTLSITSGKIFIAQQIVTQQIDIAFEIKSPASTVSQASADGNPVDQLVNKVVQKIHDEKSENTEHSSDDEKHSAAVKSVRVKVSQSFENATLALSNSGVMDASVANNVAQTRSRVDAAIDQVASQPVTGAASEILPANVETTAINTLSVKRDLSTSLQLATKEGDVVTVNFSRSQATTAGGVQSDKGSLLYAGSASSSTIAINVQGDLSESESDSIRKVVESISKLAEKLFSGNTGAAMEKLGELNIDPEILASMSLSMSSSFSYQAVSAYAQVSRLPAESAPAVQAPVQSGSAVPAASPTVTDAANNQTASAAPVVDQVATQEPVPASVGSAAAPVIREAAGVVNDAVATDVFENSFNAIRDLFAQIADMFAPAQNEVTDKRKDFVSELFNNIVDKAEDENNEKKDIDDEVTNLAA
jgi:hypothetical protein